MVNMSKKQYAQYVKTKAPSSHLVRDTALAWLSGGAICVLGQFLNDSYIRWGVSAMTAPTVTAMTLVAAAAILTAFRAYDNIAKWAGAGTLVPITGFSNAMVAPAMEFKSEGLIAGVICSKGLFNQSHKKMAVPLFVAQAAVGRPHKKGGSGQDKPAAYLNTTEYRKGAKLYADS